MWFRLGGRDIFLNSQQFDDIFGFIQGGLASPNNLWSPNNFWVSHTKPNASAFIAGHSKSSLFASKSLWYVHRFITYSFHARELSNEAIYFDDLYLIHCFIENEEVELGRWLQWRLWLLSDSVSGSSCVGGIITKIANYFEIPLNNIPSIPPSFLDENLLKNSRQFKLVRGI